MDSDQQEALGCWRARWQRAQNVAQEGMCRAERFVVDLETYDSMVRRWDGRADSMSERQNTPDTFVIVWERIVGSVHARGQPGNLDGKGDSSHIGHLAGTSADVRRNRS